jgi:ankyrin repeat protein
LFYAARDNRLEFVRKIIEYGADLNHVDGLTCQTALFYAAREGNIEMCKLLMDHGCKPQHQDSSRKTAIFYAKKSQKKEVVDLINLYLSKTKDDKKEPEQIKKKKKEKDVM